MLITKDNIDQLPYKHLSPSSIIELLVNEKSFFKKYIQYRWDETTSPAMIIGSAFHFALETHYKKLIQEGRRINPNEIIEIGISEAKKIFSLNEKKGIMKLGEDRGAKDPEEFYRRYNAVIGFDWAGLRELEESIEASQDPEKKKRLSENKLKLTEELQRDIKYIESFGIEMDVDAGFYNESIEEAKNRFIEYGKTGSKEKSIQELINGIANYLENEPNIRPLHSEESAMVEFCDFEGQEMPLPIKGKPDLIAESLDEEDAGDVVLADYKLVSVFSERTPAYELQAAPYYFIGQHILGRKIKKMVYYEVLKKETKPGAGMKKPELEALCNEHKIELERTKTGKVKDTMATMIEKLVAQDILKASNPINKIVIDFEEEPEIIQAFIDIYKEVLNRSYHYFIGKTLKFLPNPRADFTGLESWRDFVYESSNNIDPIEQFENRLKDREYKEFEDLEFEF